MVGRAVLREGLLRAFGAAVAPESVSCLEPLELDAVVDCMFGFSFIYAIIFFFDGRVGLFGR